MTDPDDIDAECEVWVGWIDAPCDVIRVRARVVRVGRPCISCGHVIREPDEHPFPDHAEDCALVIERRVEARVDAMERIPEADRAKRCR